MGFFRKRRQDARQPAVDESDQPIGYNPNRTEHLYWLTEEGYIIAQDVVCQHAYVEETACPACGGQLKTVAHINRGGQGLSELVAVCTHCHQRANFIFDISNEVYQMWWAEQLGPLYVQQFDGPPREPYAPD
jgi:5-methylcytosine-specific restriction endonuclease McrA